MLSQTAEYGLRAALYITRHQDEGPVRVGRLAEALDVPQNYLSKTLHQLARIGVLASTRGKNGGFELARPPETITLLDVISPFDKIEERRRCLLGRKQCSDRDPCAAHERWKDVAERTARFFRETSLADLASLPAKAHRLPAHGL